MIETSKPNDVLLQTDFPELELHASGKVRDLYKVDADHLLFVATDRISAFDYVLATGIPQKGRVLTQLSLFWFDFLKDIVPNHLATADVSQYPEELQAYAEQLRGRSMLVVRADMVPIECVARGYFPARDGKSTRATGAVCGIPLPAGLRESPTSCRSRSSRPRPRPPAGTTKIFRSTTWWRWPAREMSETVARLDIEDLQDGGGLCRDARHHHCRYQI